MLHSFFAQFSQQQLSQQQLARPQALDQGERAIAPPPSPRWSVRPGVGGGLAIVLLGALLANCQASSPPSSSLPSSPLPSNTLPSSPLPSAPSSLVPQVPAVATPVPSVASASPPATASPKTGAPARSPESRSPEIFLLTDTGQTLQLSARPVQRAQPQNSQSPQAQTPTETLRQALNQVIATPTAEGNAIPTGTRLLGVTIAPEGIRVNLSAEFVSGGGTASMTGRLGQILYTATTLDPTAKVWLAIDGKPLELLGGEGIEVPQPITREIFSQTFSR